VVPRDTVTVETGARSKFFTFPEAHNRGLDANMWMAATVGTTVILRIGTVVGTTDISGATARGLLWGNYLGMSSS